MKEVKHTIRKKVYQSKWYKWISLVLFILLLLCLILKCCEGPSGSHNAYISKPLPSIPGKRPPVDRGKIAPIPDDPFKREAVNDLINVYLKDSVNISSFSDSAQRKFQGDIVEPTFFAEEYKRIQFKVIQKKKDSLMAELKKDTINVKFVTHEWIIKQAFSGSNDPEFNLNENKWFYEKIGLEKAWEITKGDTSVKVAIIDDGFDLNHNELKNQFVKPWNVFNYNKKVYGKKGKVFHGTHVAGSVVGELNNNFGISGVAPKSKFIPIQISDENGIITTSSLLDGVFYALKNKAQIINLSLGLSLGPVASQLTPRDQENIIDNKFKDEEDLWNEVFEIAIKEDVLIVQAAGNDNIKANIDPMKRSPNTLIVGACDNNSAPSSFTNYGDNVLIYAPGTQIYSALPENEMGYLDGTSMASPIIAGCVALIRSYRPKMQAKEIIELIIKSSNKHKDRVIRIDEIISEI